MIHSFAWAKKNIGDTGRVVRSDRSMAWVEGLAGAGIGEGVSFESGVHGMVTRLTPQYVEAMIFGDSPIAIGMEAARTGEPLSITVGDGMLGDTFDALGYIESEGKDPSAVSENRAIEVTAGGIDKRADIKSFLETGVMIVDSVIPLSLGQRELLIGDQKTGKTHFLLSVVKNQAKKGVVCVLGLIGKERTEIARIEQELVMAGVRDQCIIIAEPAKSSAARITLVPFTAMTVAEYWRDRGRDSLVVLDDLSYHAVRYRELALLSDRYPGRDSYPSDIFYLHSRLLERAGSFLIEGKAVTITCLPVVTTVEGDISGYIETNVMSMTDGHLFFDKNLFFDGVRPAVNIFLSVTRVGRQTQSKLQREIGQRIITTMSEYAELKRFLRFGTELTERVKESIRLAHGLKEALKQDGSNSIAVEVQVYMLAELWAGVWDGVEAGKRGGKYLEDPKKMGQIKKLVAESKSFDELVAWVKKL